IWFPTSAIPDKMGPELAAMMKANKVSSVALLSNVLPFSKEIKSFLVPALDKEGIKLAVNEDYPPDVTDMTAILRAHKCAHPAGVTVLSYPRRSVLYAKQAKELGIKLPLESVLVGGTMVFNQKVRCSGSNNIAKRGHWKPSRKKWPLAKAFYD